MHANWAWQVVLATNAWLLIRNDLSIVMVSIVATPRTHALLKLKTHSHGMSTWCLFHSSIGWSIRLLIGCRGVRGNRSIMHPDQQEPPNKYYTRHMYIMYNMVTCMWKYCRGSWELLRADLYSKVDHLQLAGSWYCSLRIFLPHKIMIKGSAMHDPIRC